LATEDEIAAVLGDSGAGRVLASPAHAATIARLFPGKIVHVAGDGAGGDTGGAPSPPVGEARPTGPRNLDELMDAAPEPPIAMDSTAEAMVVDTSGTTGAPKPFTLTYGNVAANIDALVGAGVVTPDDRVVLPLPLHHVYPLVVGVLTPLSAGAAVVFPE